ncbi:hypothetical protein, partial [Burkholderia sp. SIMBA_019]|uniref:hypothetical protein n=1 Tax=Burkholderia sp. SIMBA_019 TaxID=3085765 RepID=UPI00397C15A5
PRYTREIEVALDQVQMHVAGPKRPQDLHPYGQTREILAALNFHAQSAPQSVSPADRTSTPDARPTSAQAPALPRHA